MYVKKKLYEITVFIHGRVKTFLQSTSPTLISMSLVYWTSSFEVALSLAGVNPVAVNAAFEKSRATFKG